MAWVPLLLLLALGTLCTCAVTGYVVTQAPSASVSPGQSVTLTCAKSSRSYEFHWHQQKPGSAPRFVWYGSSTRGPGIPDRFSGSTSGFTGQLTIRNAQAEDDAVYYCCVWESDGKQHIFGGGTQLNVNTGEIKAPTLSIFPPSTEEIATQKATLVCQCQDFYPAALSWTWTVNGETITSGVGSTRPTKQTDNNLFMAGSLLSIDAIDWNADKKYTCVATHEGKTFQASVKHSECV